MNAAVLSMESPGMDSGRIRRVLALVLLALGAIWLLSSGLQVVDRPVTELSIEGSFEHLSAAEVRAALLPHLKPAQLFDAALPVLRQSVEALPWVARVRIEREWPDRLRIRVWERTPVARWGSEALIDTQGETFSPRPSEVPPGLPQLEGPAGQQQAVFERYRRFEQGLAGAPYTLRGLALDLRGEWVARLAPDITVRLGRGAPEDHLPALLGPVAKAVGARLDEVETVDLRYTNGFAVSWKKPVEGDK
jgi:cell division protein FtsQ